MSAMGSCKLLYSIDIHTVDPYSFVYGVKLNRSLFTTGLYGNRQQLLESVYHPSYKQVQ